MTTTTMHAEVSEISGKNKSWSDKTLVGATITVNSREDDNGTRWTGRIDLPLDVVRDLTVGDWVTVHVRKADPPLDEEEIEEDAA